MQITITVKPKLLKEAVQNVADYTLGNYEDDVLKAAKAPSLAQLTKQLMADERFMADVNKRLTRAINNMVEDYIFDEAYDADCPTTAALEATLDAAQEHIQQQRETDRQQRLADVQEAMDAAMIDRVVKALKKAGYKIEKP
jgi:energy-converting hydrogenase A subunit M